MSAFDRAPQRAKLPVRYTSPQLVELGALRQVVRGSGTPNMVDLSALDDGSGPPSLCIDSAGEQVPRSDCDTFTPF